MLDRLNDKQHEAVVNTDGPMLVLAGAGSGKTRVLTSKIAYLIEKKNVDYGDILAITFTNKAAKEMKDRVEVLLNRDIKFMWIGTFHSIGVRILRRHADKLGYTSNFTIYDRDDQKTLLKEVYKELEISDKVLPYNGALSAISLAKNEGVGPDKYWEFYGNDPRSLAIGRVYRAYEYRKEDYNAFDFDDLIVKTLELLKKDEETRLYYQKKFKYVFVDEYQDTNGGQYELAKILSDYHKNICVVGDNDQSIYGWRGADISNILNFEKDYPGAHVVLLEQNYRSTEQILNAANRVISKNPDRKDKNLWTQRSDGDLPEYREFPSENDEARAIVQKIKDLREKGRAYRNMAILYRTNGQSRVLEEELVYGGVPYVVVGGLKFYDRKEIKDIMAYLRVIVNPRDDISLRRVINEPKRGIGDASIEKLAQGAGLDRMALGDFIMMPHAGQGLSSRAAKGLGDFTEIINKSREVLEEKDLFFAVKDIIGFTGISSQLENEGSVEARSRLENIESFISSIATYVDLNPEAGLEDYLAQVSLMSDADKTDEKLGVSLMTVHSAKGLEFPVVFIAGMEDGLFPSKYSIDEDNIEEERRLFYVAITRAEDMVYISSARSRRVFGSLTGASKSRFIEELEDTIDYKEDRSDYVVSSMGNPRDKSQNWDLDYMKYSISERKESLAQKQEDEFKLGDKVKHKKFGIGTIVTIDGNELVISFENQGIKKLRADIAPLERV